MAFTALDRARWANLGHSLEAKRTAGLIQGSDLTGSASGACHLPSRAGKEEEDLAASGTECGPPAGSPESEDVYRRPQRNWARLLHRIFEIDPLPCPKCGTEMKVVSVITEPEVIDKILKSIARTGGRDPFECRLAAEARLAARGRQLTPVASRARQGFITATQAPNRSAMWYP